MKTRVEQIEKAIKEFRAASLKIMGVKLDEILPEKFEIRQCKISIELNAFVAALQRQIAPLAKGTKRIATLKRQLTKLERDVEMKC